MIITVDVTQEDIDNGLQGNCYSCPVALALTSVFRDGTFRVIRHSLILLDDVIPFPTEVVRFTTDFDIGRPVEPFSFKIDIPDEYLVDA